MAERLTRKLRHFLLVFDHRQGSLVREPEEFTDSSEAVAAYSRTEREYEHSPYMEIVLIGSDSLETVKRTHANYFAKRAASRYLKGL
jgi:hypothetical protein